MGIIIIISIIAIFGIIQTFLAENKIGKWILPILSVLFSIYIVLFVITFQLTDYMNTGKKLSEIFNFNDILEIIIIFLVFNIPTAVFLIINNKARRRDDKFED